MKILAKVAVLVTNDKNELLLIREQYREDDGFKWNLIKGTFDNPKETIDQCAVREVYEKAGLHVSGLVLRGIFQYGDEENMRMLFVFRAQVEGDSQLSVDGQMSDENIVALRWFSADDVAGMAADDYIAPYVSEAIEMWYRGNSDFCAKIL